MSRNLNAVVALSLLAGAVIVGCTTPTNRLNAPPQGYTDQRSDMQPFFTYMTDNATLADMDLADIHFVAHTTELNSLGTDRLTRMAKLMETYGGTVRYATQIQDEEMVQQRMTHIKEFLKVQGADMDRVDVKLAMAGSHDTPAEQTMAAKQKGWNSDFNAEGQGQEGAP